MCRSEAEGGRRCPSSRGGHSIQGAAPVSGQPASDLPLGFRTVTPPAPVRLPILPGAANLRDVPRPPAKPKRMSEKRYRETYDSSPCTVIRPDGTLYRCSGPVSAHFVAKDTPGSRVVEGHHSYH
jgi:hypothetical protein